MSPFDLKPCPHCGETEGLYPAYHGVGEGKPYAIDCIGCGYDFTPREGFDVVAMWNRRFDPTDLSVLVKVQGELSDKRLQNELITSILKEAMEELGITDDLEIVVKIAANQALISKLTEALEWTRRNYASGPTSEINRVLDDALSLAKSETPQ